MSNCCTNIFDLGCVTSCETIELPFLAPADDTYTIQVDFNGHIFDFEVDLVMDDPFEIQTATLNECYLHHIRVYDSKGHQLNYDDGTTLYDCFKLKTTNKQTL